MKKQHFQKTCKHLITLIILTFSLFSLNAGSVSAEPDDVYRNLIIFSNVINEIEKNYVDPVQSEKMIMKAVQGMVRSLDPHSAYLEPQEYSALEDDTRGEFSGIGVVMIIKNDILTIISPIEGSPAYKAGIKAGDVIVKVDGESTLEMSISEAVNRIKGKKGTTLALTILRDNESYIQFDLVRDDIPIKSVKSARLQPGYGYVSISNFNDKTSDDLEKFLEAFESAEPPLSGLVLDLRSNPGGLLNQAVEVTDMFVNEGVIVSIKGRQESETQIWKAHENNKHRKYPVVVLINGGSASASEIVAGALQDHKRALILGTTSFGKGTVQNLRKFSDGSALKLTIARYYTPSGRSIQAEGITPDIELEYNYMEKGKDKKKLLKESDLKNHLKQNDTADSQISHILKNLDDYQDGQIKTELNMRLAPKNDGDVIMVLTKGDTVKIIEKKENKWLKILYKEKIGYIKDRKKFITKKAPVNQTGYGHIAVESLLRDNQVKRALELLISHNIFAERMD